MTDVTARVAQATQGMRPGAPAVRARAAGRGGGSSRRSARAATRSCSARCPVTTGQLDLYKYRRYQDVRLVFAPELRRLRRRPRQLQVPPLRLDAAFLRAWDEGKPAHPARWFGFSASGPKEGELTFVSGNPGSTQTALHGRAVRLRSRRGAAGAPARAGRAARTTQLLCQRIARADAHVATSELLSVENSYKGLRGRLAALPIRRSCREGGSGGAAARGGEKRQR